MSFHNSPPTAAQANFVYPEHAHIRSNNSPSPLLQAEQHDNVPSTSDSSAQNATHDVHRIESPDIDNGDVYGTETTPAISTTSHSARTTEVPSQSSDVTIAQGDINEPRPGKLSKFRRRLTTVPWPKEKWSSSTPKGVGSLKRWWQRHRYFNIWWWEMTCCIIAFAALVAIVVTIRAHEHKPLPQWRYGLTVNAMIAAYTVILKAAAGLVLAEGISHLKWIAIARPQSLSTFVAHDNASRGPLGALKLLWKNEYSSGGPHMSPFISSLGALITVLVLLVDPFSQQIIKTYQCERRTTTENGTIARTNVYREIGKHSGSSENTIPLSVRNAVNNGLFASQKPNVQFTCRTGNCTFAEEYTTLAFCSSCLDATDELEYTPYEDFDEFFDDTMLYTNVTLAINDRENLTLSRGGQALSRGYLGLVSYFGADLAMIRWDGPSPIPDQNQTIRGYRCNLYPCMKTFKAKINTGKIEEEAVDTSGNVFSIVAPQQYAMVRSAADLNCLDNADQRNTLQRLGYQFNETTRWLPYNVSWAKGTAETPIFAPSGFDDPCERAPANQHPDLCNGKKTSAKALKAIPARCVYNMGHLTTSSLYENLFGPMFTGYVRNSWMYAYAGYEGTETMLALFNAGSGNGTLEDVEGILRNITDSLTTYMRQAGAAGFSDPVMGEMYDYTSCIKVRWAWLSYPAIIVGALLVFFTWMAIYARIEQSRLRRQWKDEDSVPFIHDFKSSALDFLYHGLDRDSLRHMDDIGATNQIRELEKRAEKVMVTLVATDQGWKLSSVAS
ncbi:hypothetical protein T440DRAFT_553998 [Plenodomus tracheiphilus IPT5]|uniref:Uncharacterized protein n=1 Tax=Plenodomus tracheiphilus IPT5 TaxID=1408161 RepID=A0A6A7B9J9_9PLEO|nr:hypothetical protein T440DRAFT_553998 [Plenodomus tracheiphilus IPT5]